MAASRSEPQVCWVCTLISVKTKTIRSLPSQDLQAQARALLGRAVGFRDCDTQALDELAHAGQLRSLARGEYAVRRGDRAPSAWFLVDGLVEASLTHRDGQRHLLGLLLPGDFFNLMGVVEECGAEYDVTGRTPCTALLVPLFRLRELRGAHPCLVNACEKQFVFRARLFQKRLAVDPGVSVDTRTASMLKLLSSVYGTASPQGIELSVRLTQSDMADWLGMSRQRMNFVLKQLESEGLIRLQYSSLVILDPVRLGQRAEQ